MIYNTKQFLSHKPFICPWVKCHARASNKAGLTSHIRLTHDINWGLETEDWYHGYTTVV